MRYRYSNEKHYDWTKQLAYFVGLITSDGCLINNGRHINITSKDFEIIQYVKEIIKKPNNIYQIKAGQFGTTAYNFQFSNVALFDFLENCGLTPKKSLTIGSLAIPDDYYADFLRGLFDGDGSIFGYWDKRWRSSFVYYCSFASASPIFIKWLRLNNSRLIQTKGGSVRPGNPAQSLAYAKADSRLIYNYIYGSSTCHKTYSLQRKKLKFIEYMAMD
jgi:hypothetical protein